MDVVYNSLTWKCGVFPREGMGFHLVFAVLLQSFAPFREI